jgi:hypothetical protein
MLSRLFSSLSKSETVPRPQAGMRVAKPMEPKSFTTFWGVFVSIADPCQGGCNGAKKCDLLAFPCEICWRDVPSCGGCSNKRYLTPEQVTNQLGHSRRACGTCIREKNLVKNTPQIRPGDFCSYPK